MLGTKVVDGIEIPILEASDIAIGIFGDMYSPLDTGEACCLIGWCSRIGIASRDHKHVYNTLRTKLANHLRTGLIATWNDSHSKEEVAKAWNKAMGVGT